jgi:tyrosinase
MAAVHNFVRRDVWKLPSVDRTLHWYAKAISAMQARDPADPTSWHYQASIHGDPNSTSPRFNQCKHGSWNFLSWHRLYLYYFERIVRAAVVEAGGPSTWALPYWNYDDGGDAAKLPRAFRQPSTATNPLYVAERRATYNAGVALLDKFTSSKGALATTAFTAAHGATSFGGGQADDMLWMASEPGALEMAPHDVIHARIGGHTGWMNDLSLAARDPIFWLHHANIDRLWTRWLALGQGRANPDGKWLNRKFSYFDEHGTAVHNTAADALDTEMLTYRYGDESAVPAHPHAAATRRTPELVGSSAAPVELTGAAASVHVAVDARARAGFAAQLADGESPRIYLNLDDVRSDSAPGTVYGVYVNVAQGAEPDDAHYAGLASFFGIGGAQSRRADREHGYRLTYDITDLVAGLAAHGQWDEANVHISFAPLDEDVPDDVDAHPESTNHAPVTVGRVSIFHG